MQTLSASTLRSATHCAEFSGPQRRPASALVPYTTIKVSDRIGIPGLRFEQQLCMQQGTGQLVWEAGIQLACHLRDLHATGKKNMAGVKVLELGCGLGVAGITAAALGANVTLTDVGKALPLTQQNADSCASAVRAGGGAVSVEELDWAQPNTQLLAAQWDVVIGSDMVYENHTPELLGALLDAVLRSSPGAQILVGHAHRSDALDKQMTETFNKYGLEVRLARRLTSDPTVEEQDISILAIVRA